MLMVVSVGDKRLFLVSLCAYLHLLAFLQITSTGLVISVLYFFLITF